MNEAEAAQAFGPRRRRRRTMDEQEVPDGGTHGRSSGQGAVTKESPMESRRAELLGRS